MSKLSALLLCVLMIIRAGVGQVFAAEAEIVNPASLPNLNLAAVSAVNADGYLMAEAILNVSSDWTTYTSGEPLLLEGGHPLSVEWADSGAECPLTPEALAVVNYEFAVRAGNATTASPFPMAPVGRFFAAEAADGTIGILRLPESAQPAEIIFKYGGVEYPMAPWTVADVVRLQTTGYQPAMQIDSLMLETRVALLDNRSWIAFHDGVGREQLVQDAAELIVALLALFNERHGHFPGTLCELYTGEQAVIAAIPRNPFNWEMNYCATEYPVPMLPSFLRYFPERSSDLSGGAVGYWLAVVGMGEAALPRSPLPRHELVPRQTIKWYEQHPD